MSERNRGQHGGSVLAAPFPRETGFGKCWSFGPTVSLGYITESDLSMHV